MGEMRAKNETKNIKTLVFGCIKLFTYIWTYMRYLFSISTDKLKWSLSLVTT